MDFSPVKVMVMNLRSSFPYLLNDRQKLTRVIFWGIVGFFLLRSCIINSQNTLPGEVLEKLQKQYVECISSEDTPIWPGEPRQPECGTIDIKVLGKGVVPNEQKMNGITEAICFRAIVENPHWSTMGTTRHEVKKSERTTYQVTVLKNSSWQIFPDNELENKKRWATYSCPDR